MKSIILYFFLNCLILAQNCFALAPKTTSKHSTVYTASNFINDDNHFSRSDAAIASIIDNLKIDSSHTILMIGPGTETTYPLSCALRGAKVYVAQPLILQGSSITMNQNYLLKKLIEGQKRMFKKKTGVDLIGDNIDIDSYEGYVQDINIPVEKFSHIFILSVLDDPVVKLDFDEICQASFSAIQSEGTIVISTKWGNSLSIANRVEDVARLLGYTFSNGEYYERQNNGSYIDPVISFTINKNNSLIDSINTQATSPSA